METIFSYIIGLVLLLVFGKLLLFPMKLIFKLVGNGILGGLTLIIFNFLGKYIGLRIPLNPLNAIIVGFFGVPGVVVLLILGIIL